jgi:membrane protein YdbS with pleckstrin-like domain
MSFINDQVEIDSLPQFKSSDSISIDARFARIRLTMVLIVYSIALIFVLLPIQFIPPVRAFTFSPIGLSGAAALVIAESLLAYYVYAYTKSIHYAVRDHDLILGSGVFWKKEVIQPLKRIQHVEVTHGPIDKYFGLANIRLFSAGTGLSTFRIPGLDSQIAGQIKQYILDYRELGPEEKQVSNLEPDQEPEPG